MSKRKHIKSEEENGESWLLPYSDLMTLLLAIFIVLFAVSQIDVQKAQSMSEEFRQSMMTQGHIQQLNEERIKELILDEASTELYRLEELKARLDAKLEEENLSDFVSTYIDKRGLVISLSNAILFDSGSAVIKREYEKAMLGIAGIINTIDNYIRIEGHTDDVPMNSDIYPSNWELSSARAISVVRLFINKTGALPDKFLAVGYGEYRPIADNATGKGRAKNRRIDIIVLSETNGDQQG
jgi:chemotaxis protein MotB